MGDTVPVDGYITDSGRTTLEVKNATDAFLNVLRRTPGVGEPPELVTIGAGTLSPTKGIIRVNGENSVSDVLNTIDTTEYADGSFIVLIPFISGNNITITHNAGGAGSISFKDGSDFALTGSRIVWLRLNGSNWVELFRLYGADLAAERAALGLGSAAVEDTGSGNGLDADTVDGQHAVDFLGASAQAADSAQLGGVAAANFVRTDIVALQTLADNLRCNGGRLLIANSLGQASALELHIDTGMLARLSVDDQASDVLALELFAAPGGALHRGIRVTNGGVVEYYDGTTWQEMFHEGNVASIGGAGSGLDADLVHGEDGGSIFGDGGIKEATFNTGTIVGGGYYDFSVPSRLCFTPRFWKTSVPIGPNDGYVEIRTSAGDDGTTRFRLHNPSGGNAVYDIKVRYVAGDPPLN